MNRHIATWMLTSASLLASASTTAQTDKPIRIGVALSQSGNLVQLWSEQVNARGGLLGRKVELVVYDERSDPATAARLYEKLISDDKVDLLFGPWGSASSATAAAVANKHKRVFLNSGGASEQIHERGFKYVFQSAASVSAYVANIGPLAEQHGLKSMVIFARDYAGGRDMVKVLRKIAADHHIEVKAVEYFPVAA